MKKRCWKNYAPVKGKKPYSKGSCRKVRGNPTFISDIKKFYNQEKAAYKMYQKREEEDPQEYVTQGTMDAYEYVLQIAPKVTNEILLAKLNDVIAKNKKLLEQFEASGEESKDQYSLEGYIEGLEAAKMRLTGVQGNPAPYPDVAMANELYLFFLNDENLINRRYPEFVKNLERKVKRGIYDREKAVKLFMYLADEVSKQYSKQFGDGKTHAASVPTRIELAKMLLRYYETTREPSQRVVGQNPSSTAARLRRQAEIMELDERLVPSTMTYEDIKDDPKLIAHYKKIMTPMAWKQLVDDWIRSGVRSGSGRRDFVIPKESEYRRMVGENPANPAAQKRRDGMAATILITAIESGYGWFYTKNYKIAEIDDTPYKVSADLFLDEEVTKDDYPDEFSKNYQPKRTFKAGEKIHVDNSTIQKGLQLVSSGKIKVADSYRKLASKLYFWPYSRTTDDMPDFDAYDADIFLQAGVFGNVIFG